MSAEEEQDEGALRQNADNEVIAAMEAAYRDYGEEEEKERKKRGIEVFATPGGTPMLFGLGRHPWKKQKYEGKALGAIKGLELLSRSCEELFNKPGTPGYSLPRGTNLWKKDDIVVVLDPKSPYFRFEGKVLESRMSEGDERAKQRGGWVEVRVVFTSESIDTEDTVAKMDSIDLGNVTKMHPLVMNYLEYFHTAWRLIEEPGHAGTNLLESPLFEPLIRSAVWAKIVEFSNGINKFSKERDGCNAQLVVEMEKLKSQIDELARSPAMQNVTLQTEEIQQKFNSVNRIILLGNNAKLTVERCQAAIQQAQKRQLMSIHNMIGIGIKNGHYEYDPDKDNW